MTSAPRCPRPEPGAETSRRNLEISEDENENEDVIDAERVFDEVAGEEIEAGLSPFDLPDQEVESEGENDPDDARWIVASRMLNSTIAPLETDQIDRQHDEDAHVKGDPKPDARGHGADRSMRGRRSQSAKRVIDSCSCLDPNPVY